MKLTRSHRRQYTEQGYCLVKGLIPVDEVRVLRDVILALADDKRDWPDRHFQCVDPNRYAFPDGSARPISFQLPALQSEPCAAVAEHPRLRDAMATLLGDDVERFTDQIGIKFGFITEPQGSLSFFHQDSAYWKIDPELGCNCWLPMESVDRDASALAVMPGSHHGWHLMPHERYFDDPPIGSVENGTFTPFARMRIPGDQVDADREELLPMSPGDALFFTNYTWHRSEPNRAGRTLTYYAIAYQLTAAAIAARSG